MGFWIIKTEPTTYSLDDLEQDQRTCWDGVRNYQARNNLRLMKKGDLAMVYHSVGPKELVGIVEVTKAAYPDPTAEIGDWSAVDVKFKRRLSKKVNLSEIKATPSLKDLALVRQGRLSVVPVTDPQWRILLKLAHSEI